MADLMSGKVNYKQLANKYANFMVPAAKVKVNGMDVLRTQKLVIHEMEIVLSLEAASSAVIKFAHIYDEEQHSFGSAVKGTFMLGSIVEIELGYVSATEKVFKGYVEMAGVEMGESELFTVTLMDVKRLMMTSGKKSVLYHVGNYSDAFKKVMGSYSALCSTKVDATSDSLEDPIAQFSNDYDFVEHELINKGRADREFLVFAGVAYFRKPHKVTAPIIKLRYGRELLTLAVSHCYTDLKIEVIGVDDTEQIVKGSANVTANASQKNLIIPTPVYTVTDPYADTRDEAVTRAEIIARREGERSSVGQGSTLGLPEIVPGRYIEVENVDSMFDKKYYITEVTHVFTNDTFVTQFEVGGC